MCFFVKGVTVEAFVFGAMSLHVVSAFVSHDGIFFNGKQPFFSRPLLAEKRSIFSIRSCLFCKFWQLEQTV